MKVWERKSPVSTHCKPAMIRPEMAHSHNQCRTLALCTLLGIAPGTGVCLAEYHRVAGSLTRARAKIEGKWGHAG